MGDENDTVHLLCSRIGSLEQIHRVYLSKVFDIFYDN